MKEYLKEHPDYIDIVEALIEYEEDNPCPDNVYIEDKDYDCCWESSDVTIHPSKLYQLETAGILDRVFDTNSTTSYALSDRQEIRNIVGSLPRVEGDGTITISHNFPDEEELPDDLFDEVLGYEDVKWLLRRGITTDKITNFLLIGPPGSAKTVFLMCINKLEDAEFIPAYDASGPGFNEVMFSEQPKYVMFDELDDMASKHQKNLSSYTETGVVKEMKARKTREMKINTKTLASANHKSGILDHIVDRFTVLEFDEYTRDEYIEVCEHVLPMKEGTPEDEARTIAELLWEREGEGDVRQAIQVARLSRGDPQKVIGVLDDYSGSGLMNL